MLSLRMALYLICTGINSHANQASRTGERHERAPLVSRSSSTPTGSGHHRIASVPFADERMCSVDI
jgi:hypothetical protein